MLRWSMWACWVPVGTFRQVPPKWSTPSDFWLILCTIQEQPKATYEQRKEKRRGGMVKKARISELFLEKAPSGRYFLVKNSPTLSSISGFVHFIVFVNKSITLTALALTCLGHPASWKLASKYEDVTYPLFNVLNYKLSILVILPVSIDMNEVLVPGSLVNMPGNFLIFFFPFRVLQCSFLDFFCFQE